MTASLRTRPLPVPRLMLGLAAASYVLVLALVLRGGYQNAVAIVILQTLVVFGAPAVWILARRHEARPIAQLLVVAFLLKLVGAALHYVTFLVILDAPADTNTYRAAGAALAEPIRSGIWPTDGRSLIGTQFIELLTGTVFAFTGETMLGGFFVFSVFGFVGLYLIFRAVRIALPDVEPKRYLLLLFLLPSALFWPSSIGKEAWMLLTVGIVAYGAARLFARIPGGVPVFAIGLAGTAMVRPHITLMLAAALAGATLISRSTSAGGASIIGKPLRLVLFVAATALAVQSAGSFLDIDRFNVEAIEEQLDETAENTSQGASEFEGGGSLTNPLTLPVALVTVLFRPFPFEVGNLQALIASAEGTLLLALFVRGRRRMMAALMGLRSSAFLAFVLLYSLLFVAAYSSFNNFGLLARQRVLVLPLLLVILALPLSRRAPVGPVSNEPVAPSPPG